MWVEYLYEFLKTNLGMIGLAFSAVSFLLGLWVGHTFALWRDRRKEFNDASIPIRTWLLAEIDSPSLHRPIPTAIEMDTFLSYLRFWQRTHFLRAYQQQNEERRKAWQQEPRYGSVSYSDVTLIKKYLRVCLPYTQRR